MTETYFELNILPLHRKMYRTAIVILTDSDEATDVVQDAFVRLWEKRADLEELQKPEGYCVTVVKRLCIDRLRRRALQRNTPVENAEAETAVSPSRLEDSERLQLALRLMQRLPERQRKVLEMSSFEGMDNAKIAEATGLSNINVRALLSRGRRQLRELLEKNH